MLVYQRVDCKKDGEAVIKIACVPEESNELLTWGWVNIDNSISHIIYIYYIIYKYIFQMKSDKHL